MDSKTRSKNESKQEESLFKKLEDRLKIMLLSMFQSSENTLKTLVDRKIELFFQEIGGTINDLVDSKYLSIHDRTYLTPTANTPIAKTKEEVQLTVELVINDKSIDENIKKYIDELSLIR